MKTKTHQSIEPENKTAGTAASFIQPAQKPVGIMTKLEVGKPGDEYEQEADRMADRVMQTTDNTAIQRATLPEEKVQKATLPEEKIQKKSVSGEKATGNPYTPLNLSYRGDFAADRHISWIQRESYKRDDDEEEPVQMKSAFPMNREIPDQSWLENQINQSKNNGQPLPQGYRSFMESRLGVDLSRVNIHTGNEASQLNRSLQAQAFTHGNDVYFNEGKYEPESRHGQHLLAHELTHVVQQGGSQPAPNVQKEDTNAIPSSQEEEQTTSADPVTATPQAVEQTTTPGGGNNELSEFIAGLIRDQISNSALRGHLRSLGSLLQELAVESTAAQSTGEVTSPDRLRSLAVEQAFSQTASDIIANPELALLRQEIVRAVGDSPPEFALALALSAITIAALADIDASYSSRADLGAGFDLGYSFDFGTLQDLQFRSLGLNVGFAYENFRTRIGGSVQQEGEGEEEHVTGTGTGEVRIGDQQASLEATVRINTDGELLLSGRLQTLFGFGGGDSIRLSADLSHDFSSDETRLSAGATGQFDLGHDFLFNLGAALNYSTEDQDLGITGFIELQQDIWRLRIEANADRIPEGRSIIPGADLQVQGMFGVTY